MGRVEPGNPSCRLPLAVSAVSGFVPVSVRHTRAASTPSSNRTEGLLGSPITFTARHGQNGLRYHSRGTSIPATDEMIAAIARPLRRCVLPHDEPFRWVTDLPGEDWLA